MLKSHIVMKKITTGIMGLILGTVIICVLNSSIVYAGNINANEAAIVSAAQGTFDLNGIKYMVDPVFVQQLTSYLSQDDVDLNGSQKDEVIGMMFSNVEAGVAEGYLIPVDGQDKNENEESSGEPEKDKSGEQEITGDDKTTEEEIGEEGIVSDDTKKNGVQHENNIQKENTAEDNDNKVLDEIRKQPTTKTEVDQNKNKVTVTKEDNSVLIVNTVIKNTGYNMKPAMIAITGIVGIFILCIIITLKYNFFKQEER